MQCNRQTGAANKRVKKENTISKSWKLYVSAHSLSIFFFPPCVGTVHSYEGLVHEEWPRLCPGILHHSTVHLQRPPRPERTDSTSKGHRGCKYTGINIQAFYNFISLLLNFSLIT